MQLNPAKVKKDFEEVKKIIFTEEVDYIPSFVPLPRTLKDIRCYEMAYLINAGMRQKAYDSSVRDGIYRDLYYLRGIEHSWVRIDDIILDYWIFKRVSGGINISVWGFVNSRWGRMKYRERKIDYQLDERIDEVAKRLFS